jgi:6-phosphogluconolactonase (cycloisomerase 2 family)
MTARSERIAPAIAYVASAPVDASTGDDGIYVLRAARTMRAELEASCAGAQFIALHPSGRYLYATRSMDGGIATFAVGADASLTRLGETSSGGPGPCHLSVDPHGRLLYCANYGDGSISVHRIGRAGLPSPQPHNLPNHDTPSRAEPRRQEAPHAHCVVPHVSGSLAFSTDLGTDTVYMHRVERRTAALVAVARLRLPDGAGPRHLAVSHSGFAAVSCELNSTVAVLRYETAELRMSVAATCTASLVRPTAGNHPSHVALGGDRRHVYIANRGADTIAVFAKVPGGGLRVVAETPSGGACPRHFALVGGEAYVANQDSAAIARFTIDDASGQLVLADVLSGAIPQPACLVALPQPGAQA